MHRASPPVLPRYSDPRSWRAFMGLRAMSTGNAGAATRPIRRIVLHPQYDQFTSDYDLALLELSAPVFFSDLVQPVCVPAPSHTFSTATSCYVTGWGVLMEDGERLFLLYSVRSGVYLVFFTCVRPTGVTEDLILSRGPMDRRTLRAQRLKY